MVDMMFIHQLEIAIRSVLTSESPAIPLDAARRSDRTKDAAAVSKKIAQELYFQLDALMLIELAMYKLGENEKKQPCLVNNAVA